MSERREVPLTEQAASTGLQGWTAGGEAAARRGSGTANAGRGDSRWLAGEDRRQGNVTALDMGRGEPWRANFPKVCLLGRGLHS